MLRNLRLHRPLAFLDLETTGTDTKVDLIVEVSVLKVSPDGQAIGRTRRINPGIPIPAGATAVHGITDVEVAGEPRFAQVAAGLIALLEDCDLCGFNIKRFDLRVLFAEFSRVGRELPMAGRSVIDLMEIFHSRERRDLSAAVRFYCGREHDGLTGRRWMPRPPPKSSTQCSIVTTAFPEPSTPSTRPSPPRSRGMQAAALLKPKVAC